MRDGREGVFQQSQALHKFQPPLSHKLEVRAGAYIAGGILYCQINRRTLDACKPVSSTRMANTVPRVVHLADSIALTNTPPHRVQACTDGRSRGQKRSDPATAARPSHSAQRSPYWYEVTVISLRAHTASDICFSTASGTVSDGTQEHSFHLPSSVKVQSGGNLVCQCLSSIRC